MGMDNPIHFFSSKGKSVNERIKARVKARNNVNAEANRLYEVLVAIFAPLVGKTIFKQDGSLTAKCAKLLPELPGENALTVYGSSSKYSLAWCVKTCESVPPHGCCYEEAMVYVGDLTGKTLKKLCDPTNLRTDYTVGELEEKRRVYKEKKEEAGNARSALHPFGEYDR